MPSRTDLYKISKEDDYARRKTVKEKALGLIKATRSLVTYIKENQVYDKLADCGCGLYDSYRTDQFDAVINQAENAAADLEKEVG